MWINHVAESDVYDEPIYLEGQSVSLTLLGNKLYPEFVVAQVRSGITAIEFIQQKEGAETDWRTKVDPSKLSLASSIDCILGQIYKEEAEIEERSGYGLGMDKINEVFGRPYDEMMFGREFGFTPGDFNDNHNAELWKREITERIFTN